MSRQTLPATVGLILHFRHANHTVACLESLWSDGATRVLLVDNSEDEGESLAELRPVLEELTSAGMEIEILEPGRNLGFSAGVNRGLERIRRSFGPACVLLINNDATLRAGALRRLRGGLSAGAAIAIPRMHSRAGGVVDSVFYHRATGLLLRRRLPGSYEYLSGCCMLLGPEMAAESLFDEEFFFYGDDAELGRRLSQRGVVQVKVPEAIVDHHGAASSHPASLFYEYHMVRAHWILARKLASDPVRLVLYLAGRSLFLPLRALARSARHRTPYPLQGFLLATLDVARGARRSLTPAGRGSGRVPNPGPQSRRSA